MTERASAATAAGDVKRLRHFGLVVGGILLAFGVWPLVWRGAAMRGWAAWPGTALVLARLVWPRLLRHPYRAWMALARVLGAVNTCILLAIVYYLVVTPTAIVMRLAGRDPLDRRLRDRKSYWIERPRTPDPRASMERRF